MQEARESEPILYLDVDGVLLPFGDVTDADFKYEPLNRLENYSPDLVRRLGAISLNIVWCTTWGGGEVRSLSNQIGLEAVRQLELPASTPGVTRISQKLDAIIADQHKASTPLVWIDDAITESERATSIEVFSAIPNLLIQPDKYLGIDRKQLEEIEGFAESLNAAQL